MVTSSYMSYTGSAEKVNPNCLACGGRGYQWDRGGKEPLDDPGVTMPGPGMDFMILCDCRWSGWQYEEKTDNAHSEKVVH